jgi:hypothetical protein
MRHLGSALCLLALASGCARGVNVSPSESPAITSADQLLEAMHHRYAGKWYHSLVFVQTSTYYRPDGAVSRTETWYEGLALPGRLRIDLGEPSRGNGVLYRGDSLYQVQGGRVSDRRVGGNPLLTLGFDVYAQPVAKTLAQLRGHGFDMAVTHVDSLDGQRMYVVGAGPRDSTRNQFWVDADRLLFRRMIQTDQRGRTQDIRFEKYVQREGGWVAEEVRFLMGGRMFFHEAYAGVRVNVPLDDKLFVPEAWSAATHWYRP